jgi:hypothetical protein
MEIDKPQNETPVADQHQGTAADEQLDRRTVAKRLGKFVAYTAPALLALSTAKQAKGYAFSE